MGDVIDIARGARWRVPAGLIRTAAPEPQAGDTVEWLDDAGRWRSGYLFLVLTGEPRQFRVMADGVSRYLPRGRVRRAPS